MKFVYVIVSSEKDYYVEEALISMHSLKKYNPDAKITAVLDKETFKGLKGYRNRIKAYIDELITPETPGGLTATQKSRYLKTSLRQLVQGDFLYIDNDTVIKGDLSGLDKIEFDVGAVLNRHRDDWSAGNPHPMIVSYYRKAKKNIKKDLKITKFYNGGVVFARDTKVAKEFFKKWHELWWMDSVNLNYHKDQPAMWEANYQLGNILFDLDDIYNCQIAYPKYALQYMSDARILHYFSSTPFARHLKLKKLAYLQLIRDNGISSEIEEDIKNFDKLFLEGIEVLLHDDLNKSNDSRNFLVRKKLIKFLDLKKPLNKLFTFWLSIIDICKR